jgi:glycogen synthase
VFINQFGFDPHTCGRRMPEGMEFHDIRVGSDLEFGQSIYEPFGIAQVEPLSFGGICVFSSICGCAGFVQRSAGGATPNAIVADYTDISESGLRVEQLLQIGQSERERVEDRVAKAVAAEIVQRLPRAPKEFERFIDRGYALAQKMSWDEVARQFVLPGIQRAATNVHVMQTA